jgi:fructose-1,6-bisphosphatase/inositol monophosphatase family enzyme
VIIEEAGGRVTKLDGTVFDNYSASLLCTNGLIHDEMLAALAQIGGAVVADD